MKNKFLRSIDAQIEAAREIESAQEVPFCKNMAELICKYLELDIENNALRVILDHELPSHIQNFIAYSFLRILDLNRNLLNHDITLKTKVYNLLERNLRLVYSQAGIKEKDENYEKELKLVEYVTKKEELLKTTLEFKEDIEFIDKYENIFYKTIRNRENKALLTNFVEIDIYQQKFENFFNTCKKYLDSDINHKYEFYTEVINLANVLIRTFASIGTKYSNVFFQIPFTQIKEKFEINFLKTPASKPAVLEVIETEKKYPFSNVGTGYKFELKIANKSLGSAFDTVVLIKDFSISEIKILELKQFVGTINTPSVFIEFDYEIIKPTSSLILDGEIIWSDFDGKENSKGFYLELTGQTVALDWSDLEQRSPYDLEPVNQERELIGRGNILDQLRARIKNKLQSSYLYGQRRVGKTSIVKTLETIETHTENLVIINIEAGDWNDATGALKSMDNLGKKICNKIKRSSKKFDTLNVPKFEGSLSHISDFLDDVVYIDPEFRALIILDEFDRITSDLFKRTDVGQSFMLTLRAISNRQQFGFVLVGGEKLEYILSQWQEFNKFKPVRVDYFDKQKDWEDFKKLIKEPADQILEFNDKAIDYIYKQTSGNPYFTKLICIELFNYMVLNRDNHVTEKEARKATGIARNSSNIAATDFSHFWEDGIKEKVDKEQEISMNRRKILICLSELIRKNENTSKENILFYAIQKGMTEETAIKTLEEFEQRRIIIFANQKFEFIVKFFEDWLVSQGIEKIITTFEEEERIKFQKSKEEQLKITSQELLEVTSKWKTYQGQEITTDKVLVWLNQFEDIYSQRLMFKILQNLKFYNETLLRERMETLFIEVLKQLRKKNIDRIIEIGKVKRSDIIVSYMDKGPSKSGSEYAKKFVEVNNIYFENAVEPNRLVEKINDSTKVLVFVDDFIGTGQTLIENIEPILAELKSQNVLAGLVIVIGYITGFQNSSTSAESKLYKKGFDITVKILDPLNNSDKVFNEDSHIFNNPNEKLEAKNICSDIGIKLEKNHPLGYGDCQAAIVFPNTCPNNSLPIFWKSGKDWTPLFER